MNAQLSLKLTSVLFTVLWTAGMIWWSAERDLVKIGIWAACGMLAGLLWYWLMRGWQKWWLARSTRP